MEVRRGGTPVPFLLISASGVRSAWRMRCGRGSPHVESRVICLDPCAMGYRSRFGLHVSDVVLCISSCPVSCEVSSSRIDSFLI
jgi:hypothetical protein